MKISSSIITVSIAFWILLIGFTNTNQIKIPHNKIEKSIKKYLKINNFILLPINIEIVNTSQTQIIKIVDSTSTFGYVYINRVNSCRAGGCAINQNDIVNGFEYFDYFLVTDSLGNVVNVKVFNYQATHGHEIMSKGWLKQFVGFNGSQDMNYGKEIDAISGATISAESITEDIKIGQDIIQNLMNANYSSFRHPDPHVDY